MIYYEREQPKSTWMGSQDTCLEVVVSGLWHREIILEIGPNPMAESISWLEIKSQKKVTEKSQFWLGKKIKNSIDIGIHECIVAELAPRLLLSIHWIAGDIKIIFQ